MYYIYLNNKEEKYSDKEEALERFAEICHNAQEHGITSVRMFEKAERKPFNHMFTYHPA